MLGVQVWHCYRLSYFADATQRLFLEPRVSVIGVAEAWNRAAAPATEQRWRAIGQPPRAVVSTQRTQTIQITANLLVVIHAVDCSGQVQRVDNEPYRKHTERDVPRDNPIPRQRSVAEKHVESARREHHRDPQIVVTQPPREDR